ncbi:hypothetical protein A2899_01520 [Candidatus Amesbacteria bacterium RIFCSPLOWO2_01_FULL_49_25]|uniref:Methionine biosynthesis protein MetW n=1 Tax=Candidatus Amesbacteria bacterium RIFCSPHIGHO2_01_FULL_48_32b TaxID=1797253 RepID=A0A1F4YD78_9BACT|nr:MAG: hypothetical protein A2876_03180 [Candidatus Amesbacteria bacterium RIFCSPHIGHO2_01_FULL_48_32b]OGD08455.1 MAG: hypothetical protein A2899_01520 [Candidatus Amesbacteria bacterium RIFCSPLOWO2_01_FULL_49_25]
MPADNRDYRYSKNSVINRTEYDDIINLVKSKSSVIDLACGDGSLLLRLQKEKKVTNSYGIELSSSGVTSAREKGLKVKRGRIDRPLTEIKNKQFDFSIVNVTLQMVMYPELVVDEMVRISRYQIISFPNFGYLPNRIEMLTTGRMPKIMLFGYTWYSTGQIHQLSVADFEDFVRERGYITLNRIFKMPKVQFFIPEFLHSKFPNATSTLAIYLLGGKK